MFTKLKLVAAGAVALLLATAGVLSACGGGGGPATGTAPVAYATFTDWWEAEGRATNTAQSAAIGAVIDAVSAKRYVSAEAAVTETLGHEDEWAAVYGRCPDPTFATAAQAAIADEETAMGHWQRGLHARAIGDMETAVVELAAGNADLARSTAHVEAMTARIREMKAS